MLSEKLIGKILDDVYRGSVDYAEVFYEDVYRSKIQIQNQEIVKGISGREKGIGIRIISGEQSEYISSSDCSEEAVFSLLKKYRQSADISKKKEALLQTTPYQLADIEIYPQDMMLKDKVKYLKQTTGIAKGEDASIVQARINYEDYDQKVQIANTEGVFANDRRVKTRARLITVARDTQNYTSTYGPGIFGGCEFFEKTDLEKIAKRTAREAKSMLGAKKCPVGNMPVVIANGFGGLFFHEACGHSLEGDAVADGGSVFSGKLGQKVASEKLTLVDQGNIPGQWGSLGIDDEGILTRKNILIENGILKGYLVDRVTGKKLGMEPTGSARRESYRYMPTTRMTNTFVLPGNNTLEEMIRPIKLGIFVKDINAGSVECVTGEFNFNTGNTYLIENGEITVPLTNATLIGRGQDILHKIDMVADDFRLEQGFCYAASGALYIGVGQPAVRISEMRVGGCEL